MDEREERQVLIHEHDVKKATVLFMVAATIVELVMSVICVAILYVGVGLMAYRVMKATTPIPLQIASPLIFIGGLIAGYNIYKRLMRWVIDRFALKDKIKGDVYDQYLTRKERRMREDLR